MYLIDAFIVLLIKGDILSIKVNINNKKVHISIKY